MPDPAIEPPFDCRRLEAQHQAEWLDHGVAMGWCSVPVCQTHDGAPLTSDEELELTDGGDPCVPIVRLWEQ